MLMLIVSILYWCMRDKRGLGIVAIILSALGTFIDYLFYGWLAVIDLAILIVNTLIFTTMEKKINSNYDSEDDDE